MSDIRNTNNLGKSNSGQSTTHEHNSEHGSGLEHRNNSSGIYTGVNEKAVSNPVPGKGKGN